MNPRSFSSYVTMLALASLAAFTFAIAHIPSRMVGLSNPCETAMDRILGFEDPEITQCLDSPNPVLVDMD